VVAGLFAMLVPAGAGHADPEPGQDLVKYYVVTQSYQGRSENLAEIAQRLLGAAGRSADIFDLNSGRKQPDGGTLTNPDQLRPGWLLVLPWDAVGVGVRYGLLPTAAPVPDTRPTASPRAVRPSTPSQTPATTGACAVVGAASSSQSDWAALRLRTEQAWSRSHGDGVVVAVVDSGVQANLPQLTGHVARGVDVVTASGRGGDTDCLGSGTGMAGILVAQPAAGSSLIGMAPGATVLPVRVVADNPVPKPANEVTAVQLATSAGVRVLALGPYIDLNNPAVAQAISAAVREDIVVVAPAPTAGAAARPSADQHPAGLLLVGAVGVDDQSAAHYLPGSVDVVAPGVNVTTLNATGTGALAANGTQYAVAFVAGEAALVRATFPDLSAAEVVDRMKATSDRLGDGQPDTRYGWGMINPGVAVTKELPQERHAGRPPLPGAGEPAGPPTGWLVATLSVAIVASLATATLMARILPLVRRDGAEKERPPNTEPAVAPRKDTTPPAQPAEPVASRRRNR
jgi:hypothetical protein